MWVKLHVSSLKWLFTLHMNFCHFNEKKNAWKYYFMHTIRTIYMNFDAKLQQQRQRNERKKTIANGIVVLLVLYILNLYLRYWSRWLTLQLREEEKNRTETAKRNNRNCISVVTQSQETFNTILFFNLFFFYFCSKFAVVVIFSVDFIWLCYRLSSLLSS